MVETAIVFSKGSRVNKLQELHLELIRHIWINNFNGKKVADSLARHEDYWRSVVLDRDTSGKYCSLIVLRDLPHNCWNATTLFILARNNKQRELHRLIARWKPDDLEWIVGEEAKALLGIGGNDGQDYIILRAWWD